MEDITEMPHLGILLCYKKKIKRDAFVKDKATGVPGSRQHSLQAGEEPEHPGRAELAV